MEVRVAHSVNPINAYLITKILTKDMNALSDIITINNAAEGVYNKSIYVFVLEFLRIIIVEMQKNVTKHRMPLRNPTEKDLVGASVALARLQTLYQLRTSTMANGDIRGAHVR